MDLTIKKAVIPLSGLATRMYPISKTIKKSFMPVMDKDGVVKPTILILLEELISANIEEIYLIIDSEDQLLYDDFFKREVDFKEKLSEEMQKYDEFLFSVSKKIKYIYQNDKKGLGHAVYLSKERMNNEPFIMLLGDQIYDSNENVSCIKQIIKNYETSFSTTISVCETKEKDINKYGILSGELINDNSFVLKKIAEKPTMEYAEKNLVMEHKNQKKYFSIFGAYIFKNTIFEQLEYMIENNIYSSRNEYEITTAIELLIEKEKVIAFIPNGKYYDTGNFESYYQTFVDYKKKN